MGSPAEGTSRVMIALHRALRGLTSDGILSNDHAAKIWLEAQGAFDREITNNPHSGAVVELNSINAHLECYRNACGDWSMALRDAEVAYKGDLTNSGGTRRIGSVKLIGTEAALDRKRPTRPGE